jgi:ferritin
MARITPLDMALVPLIQDQVTLERYSYLSYLAAASWGDINAFPGLQKWADADAQEEVQHVQRWTDYLRDRGILPVLQDLPAPEAQYESYAEVLGSLEALMQRVTANLQGIFDLATRIRDGATSDLAQWFLVAQVQAEKTLDTYLARVERCQQLDLLDAVLYD